MAWMTGADSEWGFVTPDPDDTSAHGYYQKRAAVDKPSAALRADTSIPTSQMFSEGNGGESRKSFHGYPAGYAQLIESPEEWHITPMQIDTRRRECGATAASINNCTRFVPGPEPKQARYGLGIPEGTNYSGILECPCNDRFGGDPIFYPEAGTKVIEHKYSAVDAAACPAADTMETNTSCFEAGAVIGINATRIVNRTVSSASLPHACSVTTQEDGSAVVTFNEAASGVNCSTSPTRRGQVKSAVGVSLGLELVAGQGKPTFTESPKGQYCGDNHLGVIQAFNAKSPSVADSTVAKNACEAFCATSAACTACSVDQVNAQSGLCRWVAIPACGEVRAWAGKIPGDISTKAQGGQATITLSGPADVWFGVGLNAKLMSDSPYTLLVNASMVWEQKIGTCGSEAEHCPGSQLAKSITVVSNTVAGTVRTVVLTRDFAGATADHYTFTTGQSSLNFISAIGSSQLFAYHAAHAMSTISVTAVGEPSCLCDAGANGDLCHTNQTDCGSFTKNCVAPPAGSLLEQKNPTCNSRQYAGGLRCCHHGYIMLDQDQVSPPELLRYHMKFRFWFQEYTPATANANASHYNLERIYQQTEAIAGEYDIPPAFRRKGDPPIAGYPDWPHDTPTPGTTCTGDCPYGPDCECVHEIMYHWSYSNTRLIYAGGHCHAPACISMELYRNDTGTPELLCRQLPKYGTGNVTGDRFDESGYLALPPCLWGDDEGLEPSVLLPPNTPVFAIKKNRNTHSGHFGEMASWQMRGVGF